MLPTYFQKNHSSYHNSTENSGKTKVDIIYRINYTRMLLNSPTKKMKQVRINFCRKFQLNTMVTYELFLLATIQMEL